MTTTLEHTETRKWLLKIIRQRRKLCSTGANRKNLMYMNATVDKLVNYLNAYPYNGEKIKKFIRLFHFDILQIIPMNRSYTKNVQILKSITNG